MQLYDYANETCLKLFFVHHLCYGFSTLQKQQIDKVKKSYKQIIFRSIILQQIFHFFDKKGWGQGPLWEWHAWRVSHDPEDGTNTKTCKFGPRKWNIWCIKKNPSEKYSAVFIQSLFCFWDSLQRCLLSFSSLPSIVLLNEGVSKSNYQYSIKKSR